MSDISTRPLAQLEEQIEIICLFLFSLSWVYFLHSLLIPSDNQTPSFIQGPN